MGFTHSTASAFTDLSTKGELFLSDALGMAVVTGASSGIGAVYADRLASRGYNLLLVARRLSRLEALAAKLREKHRVQVEVLGSDLSRTADQQALADRLRNDHEITLLVNNAGTSAASSTAQLSPEKAQEQIDLNVSALTQLSLAVLPRFVAADSGTIINISSVLSIFTLPILTTYCATKAFVTHFTHGLQQELKGANVRIQAVLPAATDTEIWDVAGIGGTGSLDPATVMTAEHCVDAALAGLDAGETTTLTSLGDASLWNDLERARLAIPAAVNTGTPAPRYRLVP